MSEAVLDAEVTPAVTKSQQSQPTTAAIATVTKAEAVKTLRDTDGMKLAQLCVQSGLFKDTTDVAKAAVKMKLGYAMGLDEATAMTNIILVQGKMSFTSNFIAARIRQSGKYRYVVKEKSDKKCKLQFLEKVDKWVDTPNGKQLIFEWEKPGPEEEFNIDMAKRAGLVKPDSAWTKFPEAMLFARCLTAGARTYCSDVFMGSAIYTPDELDPSIGMTMNDQGDMVMEDTVAPVKKAAAKKPTVAVTDTVSNAPEDIIKRIQSLAKEMQVDTAPYAQHYGVSDMKKLTVEQLMDFERKLKQIKASK